MHPTNTPITTVFTETDTPKELKAKIFAIFEEKNLKLSNELWRFVTTAHRTRFKGVVLQIRTKLPQDIQDLDQESQKTWITAQKSIMEKWQQEFDSVGLRAKLEYRGCCGENCFGCEIFTPKSN